MCTEPNVTSRNRARCIREKVLIQLGLMLLASLLVPLELSTFQYNMHLFFPPLLEREAFFVVSLALLILQESMPCQSKSRESPLQITSRIIFRIEVLEKG